MTHAANANTRPSRLSLCCMPWRVCIGSAWDLPASVQKLAAASAWDSDDVRAQAMPLGQVSAFSVSLRWAAPFAGARSQALFEGRFEQQETGVILTGHFRPALPLWLCIGPLLALVYGLWDHSPSLFEIVVLCMAYGLIGATLYYVLARPAQRDAGLLLDAMRRALRENSRD